MLKNEVKLDKSTFPPDGMKVKYREYPDLNEKIGYFDAESEQILETPNGGDFTSMWFVECWEPVD